MRTRILLIVNGFYPYKPSEDYLSHETRYMKGFNKYVCFPSLVFGEKKNDEIVHYVLPPDNVIIKNTSSSYKKSIIRCLPTLLKKKFFYQEFLKIIREGRQITSRLKDMLRVSLFSTIAYKTLRKYILSELDPEENDIYVYSYWMTGMALTAIMLSQDKDLNVKTTFSRCHRFDVYEYASHNKYICYRKYILAHIGKIFAISDDAKQYLIRRYNFLDQSKIEISRLGTFDHGIKIQKRNNVFHVFSCSWLRPVKRVDMIFYALDSLPVPIEWTHYGDGQQMDTLQKLIEKKNNSLLQVNMPGAKKNTEVIEKYNNSQVDVFINVSKSEGVPVSIMEALSFGKPVIATDVGGTSEIVFDGINGYLLKEDFTLDELKTAILSIYNMSDDDYLSMCKHARLTWEERSNAETNYINFYKELSSL